MKRLIEILRLKHEAKLSNQRIASACGISKGAVYKYLALTKARSLYEERAYRYSQYCEHYRRWAKNQKRSMRQTHRAGEKLCIDYSGATMPVINRHTGEVLLTAIENCTTNN